MAEPVATSVAAEPAPPAAPGLGERIGESVRAAGDKVTGIAATGAHAVGKAASNAGAALSKTGDAVGDGMRVARDKVTAGAHAVGAALSKKGQDVGDAIKKFGDSLLAKIVAGFPTWALHTVMLLMCIALIAVVAFLAIKALPMLKIMTQRFRFGNKSAIDDFETDYYNDMHDNMDRIWQGLLDLSVNLTDAARSNLLSSSLTCATLDVSTVLTAGVATLDAAATRYGGVITKVIAFLDAVRAKYESKEPNFVALVDYSFAVAKTGQTLIAADATESYALGGATVTNSKLGDVPIVRNIFAIVRTCMQIEAQRCVNNSGFYSNQVVYALLPYIPAPPATGVSKQPAPTPEEAYDAFMKAYMAASNLSKCDDKSTAYKLHPTSTFYDAVVNGNKVELNGGYVNGILNEFYTATRALTGEDEAVNFMNIAPSKFYDKYSSPQATDFLAIGTSANVVAATTFDGKRRISSVTFRSKRDFQTSAWVAYIKKQVAPYFYKPDANVTAATANATTASPFAKIDTGVGTVRTALRSIYGYYSTAEPAVDSAADATQSQATAPSASRAVTTSTLCAAPGLSAIDAMCCQLVQVVPGERGIAPQYVDILTANLVNFSAGELTDFLAEMKTFYTVYADYDDVCAAVLFALAFKNAFAGSCTSSNTLAGYAAVRVYETTLKVMFSYRPAELFNVYSPHNLGDYWKYVLGKKFWVEDYWFSISRFWASMGHTFVTIWPEVLRVSQLVWQYFVFNGRNYLPKEAGGYGLFGQSIHDYISSNGKPPADYQGFTPSATHAPQDRETREHFSIPGISDLVNAFKNLPKVLIGIIGIFKGIAKLVTLLGQPKFIIALIKTIFGLIFWLIFAIIGTTTYFIPFPPGVIGLIVLVCIIILPLWWSLVFTVCMSLFYIVIYILLLVVAFVDWGIWHMSGETTALSTGIRKFFLCEPLDSKWYDTPYSSIGNTYQPLTFGPLCIGCLRPCPSGYIPVVNSKGALSCKRKEKDTDRYTPGGRMFKEVVNSSSGMLIKPFDRVAPTNPDEPTNRMYAFRAICKYYEYLIDDAGSLKTVRLNCDELFCATASGFDDCSCMKQTTIQAGRYLSNLLSGTDSSTKRMAILFAALIAVTAAIAAGYYVERLIRKGG